MIIPVAADNIAWQWMLRNILDIADKFNSLKANDQNLFYVKTYTYVHFLIRH